MIRCKINGKSYVGQSKNISRRWKQHRWELNGGYHANKGLQDDWNAYGEDNFEFKVIQKCNKENLDDLEIIHIKELNTFENGYNETKGGKGSKGIMVSEETKRRISEANKGKEGFWIGKNLSEEHKNKLKEYRIGTKQSEETKNKISEATKGENNPNCKKVVCVYSDGFKTEIMYQKELANYLNISEGLLKKILAEGKPYKPYQKRHEHLKGIKIIKIEESDINGK